MNYSTILCLVAATFPARDSDAQPSPQTKLADTLEPVLQSLQQLLLDFVGKPVSPQAALELEQQVRTKTRE